MSFPNLSRPRTPHDWPRQMGGRGPNLRVASGLEGDSCCRGRTWEGPGPGRLAPSLGQLGGGAENFWGLECAWSGSCDSGARGGAGDGPGPVPASPHSERALT